MIQTSGVIDKLVLVTILVLEMRMADEAGRGISALSHRAEELLREAIVELRGDSCEYKLEGEPADYETVTDPRD